LEFTGLTNEEIRQRKEKGLSNKSASQKTKTYGEIIIENVFSLFNFILIGIILFVLFFYFKNGDRRLLLDTIGIILIAFTNTSIALYQEIKSKIALDKVNLLLKKEITVIRNSLKVKIDQSDGVKDDIIEIIRGDQIVVDGRILISKRLEIDESLLTGESMPVEKNTDDIVLSGSFCVSGSGYYVAEKVGEESHANRVTSLAKKYKFTLTPLQKRINLILKVLFCIALFLVLVEILSYNFVSAANYPYADHIRKIATILISLVPQGLVLTASVTFAVGVYRISKIGAIVQKLNAVESFSNVEYVCMDKTGTLTENRLKVNTITLTDDNISEDTIKELIGTFAFHSTEKNATIGALEHLPVKKDVKYANEIPFSSDTKISVLEFETESGMEIFVLGAYDVLLEKAEAVTANKISELFNGSNLGIYRNLLFGKAIYTGNLEDKKYFFNNFRIIPSAIISISDTIRHDVMDAINLFHNNGIKFRILTGDAPEAVAAILKEIGWEVGKDEMITGIQLDCMTDEEFTKTIFEKVLFARLRPEHKLKIIKTFRKNKKHTAMIGDGVNDLPAIKSADIGIAMEEGSSITKEVADIVLLKNKFSLLPQIFDEGNKIVNSVSSVAKLFLTKNFLVIFLTLLSLLELLDFPLTPRRVSLLNVFSIGLPAFIITLKNNNVSRNTNFVRDVFSFVITSSLLIIICSYVSKIVFGSFTDITGAETDMAIMTVIIILAVVNFFIVAKESKSHAKIYYVYGFILISLFVFLTAFNLDTYLLRILRKFYEINHIDLSAWLYIAVITSVFTLFFVLIHKLRERILKTFI
jgi:cation-transporting P-type ATPase E